MEKIGISGNIKTGYLGGPAFDCSYDAKLWIRHALQCVPGEV